MLCISSECCPCILVLMYSTFLNWFWFRCCLSNVPSFYLVLLIFVNLSTNSEDGTYYNKKVKKSETRGHHKFIIPFRLPGLDVFSHQMFMTGHVCTWLMWLMTFKPNGWWWITESHFLVFLQVSSGTSTNGWSVVSQRGLDQEQINHSKRMCRPHQLKMATNTCMSECRMSFEV